MTIKFVAEADLDNVTVKVVNGKVVSIQSEDTVVASDIELKGTKLKFTTTKLDGSTQDKELDLSGLIPANQADKFLEDVKYIKKDKAFKFTMNDKTSFNVPVADFKSVEISQEAGNALVEKADGLFVPVIAGEKGTDGLDGRDGSDGKDGKDGIDGIDGKDGADGKSAYDLWLDQGNTGSVEDFLNNLKGTGSTTDFNTVAFTNRQTTVELPINDIELLFRELANGATIDGATQRANRPMVLTGIKYSGTWYGDAPNAVPFINPFTNETIVDTTMDGLNDSSTPSTGTTSQGKVTIHFVDESGNTIADSVVLEGKIGNDAYDATVTRDTVERDFLNTSYRYKEVSPTSGHETGIFSNDEQVITYVYEFVDNVAEELKVRTAKLFMTSTDTNQGTIAFFSDRSYLLDISVEGMTLDKTNFKVVLSNGNEYSIGDELEWSEYDKLQKGTYTSKLVYIPTNLEINHDVVYVYADDLLKVTFTIEESSTTNQAGIELNIKYEGKEIQHSKNYLVLAGIKKQLENNFDVLHVAEGNRLATVSSNHSLTVDYSNNIFFDDIVNDVASTPMLSRTLMMSGLDNGKVPETGQRLRFAFPAKNDWIILNNSI